jgi:hypothetical protein
MFQPIWPSSGVKMFVVRKLLYSFRLGIYVFVYCELFPFGR